MTKIGFAILAFIVCSTVRADWYGGDFNGRNGGPIGHESFSSPAGNWFSYDDFAVTGGLAMVTEVWGNFFTLVAPPPSAVLVEIRSGMSTSSMGTLEFSALGTGLVTPTGRVDSGATEYQIRLPVSTTLSTGLYHVGVQVQYAANTDAAFASRTLGLDSGPAGDPNPMPTGSPIGNGNTLHKFNANPIVSFASDLSYGVAFQTVPEPATIAALGLGGLAFLRRRRKP